MRRSRHFRVGAFCVVAATLAYGPTAFAAAKPAKSAKGKTLTLGMLGGPKTWSATDAELGNRAPIYQAVYDSLLHLEADGSLTPWLATKWAYTNADNTVLSLTLRTGVKFTDGQPFNAAAAVANLKRLKASKGIAAPLISSMADAKAVNPTTVEITLSAPDPGFLTYLGGTVGMMESPKAFDTPGEATAGIGTGPYIVDTGKTIADSLITYKANPNYWNKSKLAYSAVVFKIISDGTAMVNALKAGEVDGGNVVVADAIPDLKASGLTIIDHELDWVGLTLVDRDGSQGSPFKDLRVRQAFNHAIDRNAILQGFGAGRGTVTTQVFRKASPMYDPALDSRFPYDVAKAKALLAEAGFKDGFEITMAKITGVISDSIWVLLEDQLGKIGVKVKWVDTAIGDYFGAILTPKYPSFFMFLEQNPNDWVAINFLSSKTAIWNPSHYSDPVSEDLYNKIQRANDKDRPALLKQYGKYVTEQAWYVAMYRTRGGFAVSSKVNAVDQAGNAVPFLFNFSPK
jgi:peptide/nickel transport system substrate-binding protein